MVLLDKIKHILTLGKRKKEVKHIIDFDIQKKG